MRYVTKSGTSFGNFRLSYFRRETNVIQFFQIEESLHFTGLSTETVAKKNKADIVESLEIKSIQ